MRTRTIRIPLSAAGWHDVPRSVAPDISDPGFDDIAGDAASGIAPSRVPAGLRLAFGWEPELPTGWSGPSQWPTAPVEFSFPEGDALRVNAWFTGNYHGVNNPASTTLLNNMTRAVRQALEAYFAAADGADLFTAPLRVGWAFRFKDGSHRMTTAPILFSPNSRSPLVAIETYTLGATSLTTLCSLTNSPAHLTFTPSPLPDAAHDWGDITHIDIVAAPRVSLIPRDMRVTGVTTVDEQGTRYRTFHYTRPTPEAIAATAAVQNDFRIIAAIPVAEMSGTFPRRVPVTPGALANWKLLPKYKEETEPDTPVDPDHPFEPDNPEQPLYPYMPDEPDVWEPFIDKETDALDLGDPEGRKWLRRLRICGNYDRRALRVRVYASRHRQNWRLIADGRRGWVAGLARARYRWFRIRVTAEMLRTHYLDAIAATITTKD